jgi:hypothetical protein
MDQKWQYRVTPIGPNLNTADIQKMLDQAGDDGWEFSHGFSERYIGLQ